MKAPLRGFYGILDVDVLGTHVVAAAARSFVAAGVRVVQLRAKGLSTRAMVELCAVVGPVVRDAGGVFLVNDRVDVALVAGASGVHLGRSDLPLDAARALLGPAAVIGVSTHDVEEAVAVASTGLCDYIGLGPLFPTASKRDAEPVIGIDALSRARPRVSIPIVAIGGITLASCADVRAAGADAVAMIGSVLRGDLRKNVALAVERCA